MTTPAPTALVRAAAIGGALLALALSPARAQTPAARPALATAAADYRLAPRDLVQFQIFEEPDLLTIQRVSASGEIAVPMLGTIRIGGATLREAEQMMNRQYVEKGYFVKPQVILSLQTYAPRSVSVLGQVNKPEQIEFPVERDTIGIVQAITLAGGFTRIAKTDGVRVIRTVNGKEEQYTVNVTGYLESKSAEEFILLPDDVIYVPERVF